MVDRQEARSDVDLDHFISVQRYELAVLSSEPDSCLGRCCRTPTFIPLVAGRVVSSF